MLEPGDYADTARWYVEAKRQLAGEAPPPGQWAAPSWLLADAVAEFEQWMNGPRPFIDALARRPVHGPGDECDPED